MSAGKAHRWMSEADAVRYICEVMEWGEVEAKRDLCDAAMDGDVEVRARHAEFTWMAAHRSFIQPDAPTSRRWVRSNLSLKAWRYFFDWGDDRILISEDKPNGLLRAVATGIELRRTDVLRLWPTQDSEETGSEPKAAPNKGGRPAQHDWARAAGFLAGYIAYNDPSKPQAEKALADWFGGQGKIPDERNLRRTVSEAFVAYEKLKRRDT